MANTFKRELLSELGRRFGEPRKLPKSQSLFVLGDDAARIYLRYSRIHPRGKTFFGLRDIDLQQLEGHNSFICFFTGGDSLPLCVPFVDFEEVFRSAQPASDGQYKVQLLSQTDTRELYIARHGRFNVEAYAGFAPISNSLDQDFLRTPPDLSHEQVQTLLAGIGHAKGYDVHVPPRDIAGLDWTLTDEFRLRKYTPSGFGEVSSTLKEIDIIWITPGRNDIQGLFEVEHSTPIYSGLLRFNDVLLTEPNISRFVVVSNDSRRSLFSRQAFRPTFRKSGLAEIASFLDYANVFAWHYRIGKGASYG